MTQGEKFTNRFAIILTVCIIFLITAGSFVTSTGSGLAVPDWPNTYGENMFLFPPSKWIGGIFYEHFHRLIATTIGFLTIILTFLLKKYEPQNFVKKLGYIALGLVILQGTLGGLTVLFLLPPAISISHATIAQSFLCVVLSIAFFTSKFWKDERLNFNFKNGNNIYRFTVISFFAVYLQLIFGATMRHLHAGLVVIDWPFYFGNLFPSLDEESLKNYNQILIQNSPLLFSDGLITPFQITIHFLHRTWAFVVVGLILTTSYKIFKNKNLNQTIKKTVITLIYILFLQFVLGILTIFSMKNFIIASIHVTVGAITLALTFLLLLQVWKSKNSKVIKL